MKLEQTIRRILREQTESGGGIFYHNSDYDFNSFNAQTKKEKRTNYLFFSNEPNTFIDRKYTYKVKLQFDPNKIFNTFKHINEYGLKYTLEYYKDEVLDLFEDNLDYFLDKWTRAGVDSIGEVMEYYIDEGGDEDDMVGLLYYFLTKFNDSWAIIETDKFLDFIESKGFNGFVTHEEGLINIACKDFKSIEIIGKKEMWTDEGEGVKSLNEGIKNQTSFTNKNVVVGEVYDESDIYNYVQKLHFKRKEDFWEGNLGERIEKFPYYVVKEIPLKDIDLDRFYLDDDDVQEYVDLYEKVGTYPPIVLGKKSMGYYEIIDGTHRANALKELGHKTIISFVGKKK